jgi:hypothetical protein
MRNKFFDLPTIVELMLNTISQARYDMIRLRLSQRTAAKATLGVIKA